MKGGGQVKITGQHGEFGSNNGSGETEREIEIEEGERIGVMIRYQHSEPVREDEVMSFFMPGKLTLIWKKK